MGNLILILTVLTVAVSCGKKSKNKSSNNNDIVMIQGIQPYTVNKCNSWAFNGRCTPRFISNRILEPYELYDRRCVIQYQQCLDRR